MGSKSCKVEIDGGGVWKRHADQMTTTGVGNGIEDEPVSMAVESEWSLDRQVPEVLPDSSDTEPGDMPGKLTSVNSTSPLAPHQRRNHLDNGQLSPELPLTISCDISPYGFGAVLSHIMPDGVERPVAYASRTLTTVEHSYAQIDTEELAVAWGVKYFHQYLYGIHFTQARD
ncbi:hypothetical protein EMCRGX_G011699 [Ephydatia muelleri]